MNNRYGNIQMLKDNLQQLELIRRFHEQVRKAIEAIDVEEVYRPSDEAPLERRTLN